MTPDPIRWARLFPELRTFDGPDARRAAWQNAQWSCVGSDRADDRFVDPLRGSPAWVGIQAADAALDHRQDDGANATYHYRDISNYQPINAPDASPDATDPNRWQPLIVTNFDAALRPADFVLNPPFFDPLAYGHFAPQMFIKFVRHEEPHNCADKAGHVRVMGHLNN